MCGSSRYGALVIGAYRPLFRTNPIDQKKCIDSIDFVIVNGAKIVASIDIDQHFFVSVDFVCVMSIVYMMSSKCLINGCVREMNTMELWGGHQNRYIWDNIVYRICK